MLFVQDFHSFPGTHGPPLPSETETTEAVLAFILRCIQNAKMAKVYLLQATVDLSNIWQLQYVPRCIFVLLIMDNNIEKFGYNEQWLLHLL